MVLPVSFDKLRIVMVQIDLGSGNTGVPHQPGQGIDVATVYKEVGSVRVP